MKIKLAVLFLCSVSFVVYGNEENTDFRLFNSTYILKRDDSIVGEIKRTITEDQGKYTFRSETRTTGLIALFYTNTIHEQTTWEMSGEEFKPLHYRYYRDKNGKERIVKIDFDEENQRIITHAEGSHWSMDLAPEIYDKLLYELVIMKRLQKQQVVDKFQIADGGKLKTYTFNHLGTDIINTPIGKLTTVKLERHKSNSDKTLTVWYAIEKDYLPVKVENIDSDGKTVTAIIKQLDFE